jgi:shikimate kinase
MDLDAVIEESQGRSIPDIFAAEGEAAFRQMEVEALSRIIEAQQLRGNVVVALGGGAVMTPECAELVRKKTHCIYLRASVDTLVSHLENEAAGRPMLQGASLRSRIEELMALRSSTYEATAHDVIDTDGKTVEEVAAEIKF